jgi:hypothetical protein
VFRVQHGAGYLSDQADNYKELLFCSTGFTTELPREPKLIHQKYGYLPWKFLKSEKYFFRAPGFYQYNDGNLTNFLTP